MSGEEAADAMDAEPPLPTVAVTGGVSAFGFVASYDFLADEVIAAEPGSEALKTALHEAVHVYQQLTTSYGYYVQCLQDFQANAVAMIVVMLTSAGIRPILPLQRHLPALIRQSGDDVTRRALGVWRLAELVFVYLEGSTHGFSRLYEHGQLGQAPMIARFRQLDVMLGRFLDEVGRASIRDPGNAIQFAQTEEEILTAEQVGLAEKILLDADVTHVLESAAIAAEYWEDIGPIPSELNFETGTSRQMIPYRSLLQRAQRTLGIESLGSFMLTFSAVADVALNPPLLPHHAAFRGPRTALADLHPYDRLETALPEARALGGLGHPDEYEDFAAELSRRCGWPAPGDLRGAVLDQIPSDRGDIVTQLYCRSLALRAEVPGIFQDMSVWLGNPSPAATTVRRYFAPVILQFKDTLVTHTDHQLAGEVLNGVVWRAFTRRLMQGSDSVVTLPWAADDDELDLWTSRLHAMATSIGLSDLRPSVRPSSGIPVPHQ